MNHLSTVVELEHGQAVRVALDAAANVLVMTEQDYSNYRTGRKYSYYGGYYKSSPAIVHPPTGRWIVVVDIPYAGRVSASVSVS